MYGPPVLPSFDSRAWKYLSSPWDLYESGTSVTREIRSMVVSLGTQECYGFRRMLERLVPIVPVGTDVLWQTGSTDVEGLGIEARAKVPAQ